MPTVPKDDRVVPFRPQPSETDLMMALATMKDLGRIPTFDERFRGQDQPSLPIDVQSKGGPVYDQSKAKAEMIPSDEALMPRKGTKVNPRSRESIGVFGGSR